MDPALLREIARAVDRSRRHSISCRVEQQIADVPHGWMCWDPDADAGEFPSSSPNRIHWFAVESPLTAPEIREAIEAVRARALRRMFIMMSPRAWTTSVDHELVALGASRWPEIVYPVLVRPAAPVAPARPTNFSIRIVSPTEAPQVLTAAAPWYDKTWAARAQLMLDRGVGELHAAFDGDMPAAFTFLMMDGDFSYLGAASTNTAKRGRGAQSALICHRITRAAALGARWCISETNTAIPVSFNNLKRCGFEEVFYWKVYRWDDPKASIRIINVQP